MAFTSNDVIQCTSSSSFEYDVFVSFRGEDTRNSFTGFLLQALKKEGIEAFKDDKDIRKGESIAPELIRAIEGSHVFLVVFSKDYASSTWCLRELAHIRNCIQTSPRHLLPIFYDVDPSQVRKQSGDYQKAFAQHQQSFRFQEKEINIWREVLELVANLSGWDIRYKQQHAVIEEIVQQIKNILGSKFSTLPYDNLVGMESHFAKLSKLICLGPANDVRVVGITGMGGIGKSTLGRALYERISHQFNSLCYIDDPAENVEAIVVQMNHHHGTTMGVDGLSTMSHLKLLQLESSIPDSKRKFSGMLVNLSNELGYLKWIFYPFKCLPPSFEPDKLVELILRHSNIKKLWKGRKKQKKAQMSYIGDSLYLETLNLQGCIQLKEIGLSIVLSRRLSYLDLKDCKCLINLPRFGEDLILQILVLEGCQKLRHIDSSIGLLKKLRRLDLKNCKNLVSLPNSILGLNSLECLNLSGCSKLYNIQLLYELRDAEHLKKIDIDGAPIHFQSTSSYSRQHKKSVGCLMPSSPIFPCMCELDLSFCNLVQIPDAIGIICCLEKLDLSGNNFVTLPNLKKLSKLFSLKLQHCKKLKSLPELPSRIDLPTDAFDCFRLMIPSYFKNEKIGLYIFNCPELVDRDRCTDMALSWMILISQVQFKLPFNRRIQSVTTGSEIPRWFNNQHEGNCVSLDASPVMHDHNWIGVAFCLMFVVPHETLSAMGFSDSDCPPWHFFGDIPVDFYGDLDLELVLDKSDHMWLFFVSRTQFSRQFPLKLKYLGRLVLKCDKRMGWSESYAEVKKYGYRWVYKEDKEEPSNPLARKRKFGEIEENEGKRKKGIISAEGRKDDATSSQEKTIKLLQNEFENLSL
ncbi:hypothetical protein GLYMA_06G256000v4 [Glycine max]|uniref:TIR domain-containing protein n=1 Tax=Glycine max TaxID=3847 RepID=K7KXC3_SOYBN|nr:hypothetical protein GYH30_016269 [Glycine max]KRH55443.1 hypothetical protein GLYMA_06G256000v4 [Glycine max]